MIITKLTLNNFRQYKGNQEIKFSKDPDKNVTVILGINTSGKTTLIEAFKWCLYGKTTYPINDLINAQVKEDMEIKQSENVYVEVVLSHDGTEYIIRRKRSFQKTLQDEVKMSNKEDLHVSYKEDSGESRIITEYERQDTINNILPEDLSEYFFFDGERIGDISSSKISVKKSVQGLMGLDAITSARDRLDSKKKSSITSDFEKQMDLDLTENNENLTDCITRYQTKLEEVNKDLYNYKEEIDFYRERKDELTLNLISNQDINQKQKERESVEKKIKEAEERLQEEIKQFKEDFSIHAPNFFLVPIVNQALKVLSETNEDIVGIPGLNASTIEYLLDRNICICGRNLSDKEAFTQLEHELKLVPPYHIGTEVKNMKNTCERIRREGETFLRKIRSNYTRYINCEKNLGDLETRKTRLTDQIGNNVQVEKFEYERQEVIKKIEKNQQKIDECNKEIGALNNELDKARIEKKKLVKTTQKNKEVQLCIAYCEELYNHFNKLYLDNEIIIREALEKSINEIFTEMYHGNRIITIDDDYRVRLGTDVSGKIIKTSESKGLEAVKNFSFVCGLVKVAKDQTKDTDSEIITDEPYPLIMDAPFSNVDEKHIKNITKILPDVAEQVIIILMEKDWNYAKSSLEGKVGLLYEIQKIDNQETHSKLEKR